MARSSTTIKGGLGLCQLLTVLFVALKLCGKIDWGWWWVLSPIWLPWAAAFVVLGAIGTVCLALQVIQKVSR